MFNLLVDILPETVEIDGIEYEINSNFRNSILFECMINDNSLSEEEKVRATLDLYYPIIPKNINEAVNKAIWFYSCDKKPRQGKGKGKSKKKQIYSFEQDADFIYSAFMHDYKINLNSIDYLHWWEFKALFKSLNETNEIVKIMGYRATDLSKIKDKEQKAFYKQMQELYKIEDQISDEDLAELEKWNNILK